MDSATIPTMPPAPVLAPASRKEQAMWLLERLVPESRANNLSLAFRVAAPLDPDAVRAALAVLFRRHEVLRTTYLTAGAALMKTRVAAAAFDVPLQELTLPQVAGGDVAEALRPFVNRRFHLDGRPLVRAGLFAHDGGSVLCLAFHHLVYDIISGVTVLEEFVAAYEDVLAGRDVRPELLDVVPAHTEPEPGEPALDFWRTTMGDFDPAGLDLWCGAPDEGDPTLEGDHLVHRLSAEAVAAVADLQRSTRAPQAVVLLAAYQLLLAAHGAGPDITVGTPVSVRPPDRPGAVGHHTNVLPLRVRVDPAEGFAVLARRVRDGYFAALSHAEVPVDSITELVPRVDSAWRNRMFRHLFNYFPGLELGGFELAGQPAVPVVVENGFSKFDLEFFISSSADGLLVTARYGTQKFTEQDVRALVERYDALLVMLRDDPERAVGGLRVWSPADHAVIGAANDTAATYDPTSVPAAVYGHALATPSAIAVQDGDRTVDYRQLWASALAARESLQAQGVGPGEFVAVAAARSPELVATVLGIWLAGAAYLPLDPEHPAERLGFLLSDSGARLVLADRDLGLPVSDGTRVLPLPGLIEPDPRAPVGELPFEPDREACAYLIYTSGSTGRPKGALLPHRAISNIAADYTVRLRLGPEQATLWMTTFAFDMANLEHYVPLYSGGRIVVAPDDARVDGKVLRGLLERYSPDVVQATPTTLRLVLDQVADLLAGRRVVTGGEMVPLPLARELLATGCELHHAYGPTETTTWCTWGVPPADLGDVLDIGGPIWNTQVMVVAPDGRELPVGVGGELWIAGDGVALGYHARPELTAERFGTHPEYGRYYRSGDLGRWLPDGTLQLFGRADRQIKLRGNRVELGEIEETLRGHEGVRAVAVIVTGDRSSGDGRLIAFAEPASDAAVDREKLPDALWQYAQERLPRYEWPQRFVLLDALPVSTNEKVDYVALEALARQGLAGPEAGPDAGPDAAGGPGAEGAEGAEQDDDPLVQALTGFWRTALDRPDLGAHANFFAQGGHSLLAAMLVQRVEEELGFAVKLADLFTAPTPAALAARIRETSGSTEGSTEGATE